jgi:gluconate 2-dehydrogenase alpha chain
MTFDYKDNDQKVTRHGAELSAQLARAMNPTVQNAANPRLSWSVTPYQNTHNTGGTIMGLDPSISAVNRYLQSWDVPNVFVLGASVFPHNSAYNPTGPVGALAYWAADAIRDRYLKAPGRLV